MTITLLQGDNIAILPTLAPRSVQAIVTSPPYYGLRNYGLAPTAWPAVEYTPLAGLPSVTVPAMSCCLGLESDPLAYVGHLVYVWRELRRVLRDDGVCWLNLGDSYAASAKGSGGTKNSTLNARRDDNGWLADDRKSQPTMDIRTFDLSGIGLKPKDLLMIPARVALALQADGWYLRSDVIWSKPNPMPESVTDRPTKAHEYIFLLAKSERYFYDAEAVAEAAQIHNGLAGTFKRESSKRAAVHPGQAVGTHRPDRNDTEQTGRRNRRTVWSIATQPVKLAHFATMPEALIRPCILAGSAAHACERCGGPWVRVVERESFAGAERGTQPSQFRANLKPPQQSNVSVKIHTLGFRPSCACENDGRARSVVLDPFAGSGTTLRVAEALGRDAIGIELNEQYIDLQEQRTNGVQKMMVDLL